MSGAGGLVPVPAPGAERPAPLGRGTLGRQLVIRVTALVALAAILLGGTTALATRQLLIGQLDKQINAALTRQQQFRGGGAASPGSWQLALRVGGAVTGSPPGGYGGRCRAW